MASALTEDTFEEKLRDIMDQGFRALKLSIDNFGHRDNSKSDREWDECEANLLKSARTIVGNDIQLMLDVYGSNPDWTPDFSWAVKTT